VTLGSFRSIESFFRSRSDLKDKVDIVTYRRYRGYLDVHRDLYAARRSQIASRLKLNRESQPYPVTAVIFRRRTRRWGRSLNAAGLNGPLAAKEVGSDSTMDFEPLPLAPAVRRSPRKVSVAPWAPPHAGAGRAAASATASGAQ